MVDAEELRLQRKDSNREEGRPRPLVEGKATQAMRRKSRQES